MQLPSCAVRGAGDQCLRNFLLRVFEGKEEDMAIGPDHKAAFVAFSRFSFGARGGAYAGDLARAASDPRGFLKAELLQPAIARLDAPALPQTKVALTTVFADQEQKRKER